MKKPEYRRKAGTRRKARGALQKNDGNQNARDKMQESGQRAKTLEG
jgi:hypothetical protein